MLFADCVNGLVPSVWPSWTMAARDAGVSVRTMHTWRKGERVPALLAFERLRAAVAQRPRPEALVDELSAAWMAASSAKRGA